MTGLDREVLVFAAIGVAGVLSLTAVRIGSLFVGGRAALAVPVAEAVIVGGLAVVGALAWFRLRE